MGFLQQSFSREQIKNLARAVHDEIYSIENSLKRRGYKYSGHGSADRLILPKGLSSKDVDRFYQYMASPTFRNVLKSIAEKKVNIVKDDYSTSCTSDKLTSYFDFLSSARMIIRHGDSPSFYSLAVDVNDIGPTLEWYVAEIFKRELASTSDWGVRIKNVKPGGDFDVMARIESALIWIETKSTRPKDIKESDIRQFLERDQNLDPDVSIFLVDTSDDLCELTATFKKIILPVYSWDVNKLPEFGNIYHTLWRIFITNTEPSILTNLRYCLNYYFTIMTRLGYVSREKRLHFLTER